MVTLISWRPIGLVADLHHRDILIDIYLISADIPNNFQFLVEANIPL